MKPYGINKKFCKFKSKQDHIKGPLKKKGYQNWWEEIAENVNKTTERMNVKKLLKNFI